MLLQFENFIPTHFVIKLQNVINFLLMSKDHFSMFQGASKCSKKIQGQYEA